MYKNFIVTGLGGSGTKFLATMLNKSKAWYVSHEGTRNGRNFWPISHVNETFQKKRKFQHYGDVNGFLRCFINQINDIDKKAIILRDTKETLLSWYDHWEANEIKLYRHFYNTYYTLLKFDEYIQAGMKVIDFREMTTNVDYLNDLIKWVGIEDLTIKSEEMIKINSHYKNRLTYEEIPERERLTWEQLTEWFIIKYKKYVR